MRCAPMDTPIERRLQTAGVIFALLVMPTAFTFYWYMLFLYLGVLPDYLYLKYLFPAYLAWQLLLDRDRHLRGGRPLRAVQRLPVWKHFRRYFPSSLHVVRRLDPSRPHVLACHPHGIIGVGVLSNIVMDADGQREALGLGDSLRVLTVTIHFVLPLLRDFIMGLGFVDASKRSMQSCLQQGLSVGVVVGGAKEALDAHPMRFDLTLKRRKGFVKHALRHGAALVPVVTFGENEVFRQVPNPRGSLLRAVQEAIGGTLGWTAPLFYGRGVMQYSCGLLPHRHPLRTVVGPPLSLPRLEEPSQEDVDAWHGAYCSLLQGLYEGYRGRFRARPELIVSEPLAGEMPPVEDGEREGDEEEDDEDRSSGSSGAEEEDE